MEESSEAHMETDVSSTTEDVPETQEVTGSHGNVEMVIVVEKVEEDMDTSAPIDKETSRKDDNTSDANVSPKKSPQKHLQAQMPVLKLPIKISDTQKSPSKPESTIKILNVTEENVIQPSSELQQTEVADSSSKEPPGTEDKNTSNEVQKSPVKDNTVNIKPVQQSPTKDESIKIKPLQKSPIKDVQSQETLTRINSPAKEFTMPENSVINGKINTTEPVKDENTVTQVLTHTTIIPVDVTVEREASNDSQVESHMDHEKDHSKGISRELKSLIKSAKESKIISECTQLTSKIRKSRNALDTSNTSLNTSVEADKIHGNRRSSNNSQKSNCSEKSEKMVLKRSMRSQNPEFASKVKQFLNSVTCKVQKGSDEEDDDDDDEKPSSDKTEEDKSISGASAPKLKKTESAPTDGSHKLRSDPYCWRCHWAVEQVTYEKGHSPMVCTVCPRSFHFKCLSGNERNKISVVKNWVCPECMLILQAESSETRSPAMKKISLGMLCDLLKYALERMMDLNGVEPFMQPVDRSAFPEYDKYVVHPMDLTLMKAHIAEGLYGSTEAFLADTQWILHNSIIFNALQSRLTGAARALVRSCRAEMGEIEACPECYAAAHARRPTWFTDVCTAPHVLLWAKLKGFPYWPAKGMSVNGSGHVDVRFFGAHDRAWVPAKDCFLYSEKDPNNFRTKRQDILDSMQEAEQHIRNISRKYGKFVYPPFKTQFDPSKLNEQLKMMIPSYEGEVRSPLKDKTASSSPVAAKEKSRSNSKSSKCSANDGDMSECEDTSSAAPRKMADGAEIAREEDDSMTSEKNNTSIDVNSTQSKANESSRKRRRSELEEAVITIIETSSAEKRTRVEEDKREEKKAETQEPSSSKEVEEITTQKAPDVEMREEPKSKDANPIPKATDTEPSSSTVEREKREDKKTRVTPIRIAIVQKDKKNAPRSNATTAKIITPNKDGAKTVTPLKDYTKTPTQAKDNAKVSSNKEEKSTPSRQKPVKPDKTPNSTPKEEKAKERRRNSRQNKSLNNSTTKDKSADKKAESASKTKDAANKEKDAGKVMQVTDKTASPKPNNTEAGKTVKDRLKFDEDTALAMIARESGKNIVNSNVTGLPTISSVRSLSTTAQNTTVTASKTTTNAKSIEITIEANSDSSIFTPTSTENVKNMKDAVTKLQRLRNETEPLVGRVGVRAFARMTSPEKPAGNDNVQVEIKAEPIDLDDPERHNEKMDLMNAFRLRPVNPPTNLRDVRINKVVVTPLSARKPGKPAEVRPRAKKSFPQPKKPDDGRSELNGKNSMVYIPIQPPPTQAPLRGVRPAAPTATPVVRHVSPITSISNQQVNTLSSPIMQVSSIVTSPATTSTVVSSAGQITASVGQMSTTVHTVPLMTSVNGQWMFSFQPVMSVGAIDGSSSPVVNGVGERSALLSPLNVAPTVVSSTLAAPTSTPIALSAPQPTHNRIAAETNQPGEPPRLQQRPASLLMNPLDPNAAAGSVPPPSTAGPLTAKLNQNAVKLADFFRTLLEDSLEKLEEPATQLAALRLQLEQAAWKHKQELDELKHNHELVTAEMRASHEKEKMRAVNEARRTAQIELEAAVKQAKSKQWCANCSQEAQFYCCWNTSYCDYPCQRTHWATHFSVCTQQRDQEGNKGNGEPPSSPERRLQPQPDNLPKNVPAPTLTVGGKLASSRVYGQDQNNGQKSSIIVSMVEESNGNQTLKCVGTYKQPSPAQMPVILNKQLLNNEEAANKKLMSSGGYLIVGAGGGAGAVVTPARRAHAIQYYT